MANIIDALEEVVKTFKIVVERIDALEARVKQLELLNREATGFRTVEVMPSNEWAMGMPNPRTLFVQDEVESIDYTRVRKSLEHARRIYDNIYPPNMRVNEVTEKLTIVGKPLSPFPPEEPIVVGVK